MSYNQSVVLFLQDKQTQFTKAQKKLLATHADVKTHEILVLLLRLRQICCHPALIQAMLDQEDVKQSGIMDMENVDLDILSRMNNMSLDNIEKPEEESIDERIAENLLTSENPVFSNDRISSKVSDNHSVPNMYSYTINDTLDNDLDEGTIGYGKRNFTKRRR